MKDPFVKTNILVAMVSSLVSLALSFIFLETVLVGKLEANLRTVFTNIQMNPSEYQGLNADQIIGTAIREVSSSTWMLLPLASFIGFCISFIFLLYTNRHSTNVLSAPMSSLLQSAAQITATVTDKLPGQTDGSLFYTDYAQKTAAKPSSRLLRRNLEQIGDSINQLNVQLSNTNRKLSQRNYQLRLILQALKDGVIAVSADGKIHFLTERAEELLGPKSSADYLPALGANYAKLFRLMQEENGEESREQRIHLHVPEDRIIDVYITPFSTHEIGLGESMEDNGFLLVISDVTRIVRLEELRSDFVSNVTHELKTPLTSIQGYLELLKATPRDLETRQQFYEIIDIEVDRLKSLISDLLDLSEIERNVAGDHQNDRTVYLYSVVDEIITQLSPMAEQAEVIMHNEMPEDFIFSCQEKRIAQLFTNLMANAVTYNKPGGEVWVKGEISRNRLLITVQDNGIGIAPEDQERIFERFYRVHKERSRALGGTGLGLSIVKHLVNLYGGTISVESEMGQGTTFKIVFPLGDI